MILIYLLVLLVAFWVFKDAQKFGYRKEIALLWAVGIAIPTFAWIVFPLYLVWGRKMQMKNKQEKEKNKEIEMTTVDAEAVIHEETTDCPMCAKKVREDADHCPYCGYTLYLVCTNCGETLEREWQYCPHCQAKSPEK